MYITVVVICAFIVKYKIVTESMHIIKILFFSILKAVSINVFSYKHEKKQFLKQLQNKSALNKYWVLLKREKKPWFSCKNSKKVEWLSLRI